MPNTKEFYYVYVLLDPFTNLPKYVECTTNLHTRLRGHLNNKKQSPKGIWIRSLLAQGKQPIMQTLEVIADKRLALAKEQSFIRHFLDTGHELFNAKDLNTIAKCHSDKRNYGNGLCRSCYGKDRRRKIKVALASLRS